MSYSIRTPGSAPPAEVRRVGTPAPAQSFRPDPVSVGTELMVECRRIERDGAGFVVHFLTHGGSAGVPFIVTADRRLAVGVPADWPNRERWEAMIAYAVSRAWPERDLGPMPFTPARQPDPLMPPAATQGRRQPGRLGAGLPPADFTKELEASHRRLANRGPHPDQWRAAQEDAADILAAIEERLATIEAERLDAITRGRASYLSRIDADLSTLTAWREIFTVLRADIVEKLPAHEQQHAEAVAALRASIGQLQPRCAALDARLLAAAELMRDIAAAAEEEAALQRDRSTLRDKAQSLGLDAAELLRPLEPQYRLSPMTAGMEGPHLKQLLRLPGIVPRDDAADGVPWIHWPRR